MDPTTTCESERLAVDVQQMTRMLALGTRTLRRLDASGKIPAGFKVGARKLWRVSDLERWVSWGFPNRAEFEARTSTMK